MTKFQDKSIKILDTAMQFIKSVPYSVSARWLFYRLLQSGAYSSKDNYKTFLQITARARKTFLNEWRPDTLTDETRQPIYQCGQYDSTDDWFNAMAQQQCSIDEWFDQENYVEIWFEAQAMQRQFEYYTDHITLRPFKGDPSIPYKWEIAKHLEYHHRRYQLPIKILYFGDLDKKGLQIPNSALRDIRGWCSIEFDFILCGLIKEQVDTYQIPENPEKPGEYQWEAVDDLAAGEIISESMAPYLDQDAFDETTERENKATSEFQMLVKNALIARKRP